jgi:hypothetical protein
LHGWSLLKLIDSIWVSVWLFDVLVKVILCNIFVKSLLDFASIFSTTSVKLAMNYTPKTYLGAEAFELA